MLQAGVEAMAAWRHGSDYQVVSHIYRAMAAKAPHADVANVADVTRTVLEVLEALGYPATRGDSAIRRPRA